MGNLFGINDGINVTLFAVINDPVFLGIRGTFKAVNLALAEEQQQSSCLLSCLLVGDSLTLGDKSLDLSISNYPANSSDTCLQGLLVIGDLSTTTSTRMVKAPSPLPSLRQTTSTRSHATTRRKDKEIVKAPSPPPESTHEEVNDE
ncbi:hypothetical protein Tco_0836895 [Tanacetum coccineum]